MCRFLAAMALFRFLWIFLLCFSLTSTEPVCSRFHYEEQTLKKMLMVEILVDKLKAEMEGTAKSVNDALSELKAESDASKQELKQFQTSIKLDMDRKKQEIEELKDSVVAKEILFSARGIKNLSPSKGETLVFQTAITNKGDVYDNTTGIFMVPVSGMFMFSLQLCVNNNNYIYYEIITNNHVLLKGLSTDDYGSYIGCYATSVPAFLTAGERVWVKTGLNTGSTLWEDASQNWNMFSGVLVQT